MLNTKMIGNKIAEARKKLNISQAQLAEQVSISPQAVGKWERGESMPDITTLNRLAEIFGVDLNYFSENVYVVEPKVKTGDLTEKQVDDFSPSINTKKHDWNWDMSKGNWLDADFSGLKNLKEKFSSSNMKNCKFIKSDLSGLMFGNNNIENCDFSFSDIRNSKIQSSNL
ncbi:MAG: helix-turn-helix domain-containing protein, partial [Bacteroidia bacterium]|nr:helix-turn-helix domain-containing protein [Bacteroidia bacterium]